MKATKICGAAALILAVLICITGVVGFISEAGKGPLGGILEQSSEVRAQLDKNDTATKSATAAGKKATNAVKASATAVSAAAEAAEGVAGVKDLLASGTTGEDRLDALLTAAETINAELTTAETALQAIAGESTGGSAGSLKTAIDGLKTSAADIKTVTDAMVMDLYIAYLTPAQEAINTAETNIITALEGADSVYAGLGAEHETTQKPAMTEFTAVTTPEEAETRAAELTARAAELETLAADASAQVTAAADTLAAYKTDTKLTFSETLANTANEYAPTLLVTAGLLFIVALVLLVFEKQFFTAWKKNQAFPVFIVLLAMLIFQAYAIGFNGKTAMDWFSHWTGNVFNVFRANTSVGMIALGMTFVIITGGIDLAVGSTLAGIGTIMMVLMDTSSAGILTNMGITGVPLMLIAILGGILAGVLFGLFTGLVVTKGRVPPFIVTLGTMQIIRSVAQYFTQSYSPKIPDTFQVISNTVICGQRLLPIVYWLVLAVIMYVVSKHTAFGRYIFAVGSNERTTKLSGINTDAVKVKVYVLMGVLVALASIVQLSRLGGMDVASAGSGYEMDAIAAVVVGGTSMAGGKGSIVGTIFGVLIIGLMNNILVLIGVDVFLTEAFKGAIVLIAVLMQRKEKLA